MIKFFDAQRNEVSAEDAAFAVDLEIDKAGLVVRSRVLYPEELADQVDGEKEDAHWVTIDDRPVFIGRPGQGAGVSEPQETGQWGLSGDEAKLKDTRIASLCARGKMTRSQTANTKALLQGVPLSDLDDLAYIKVAREGDPELKQRGLTVNERGYISLPLDPGYGSREQVGFYDYVNKTIVMAPAEIYGAGNFLIHELGHHVLNNNDTAMRVSSVVVGKINAQIHALESSDQSVELQAYYDGFGQAGLRKYSMTNPKEFLADAYMIWRLSGEDTKQKLAEIWQSLGSSSPHYKPLDMLIAEHAAEKAWGRKEEGRFVTLGEGGDRRVVFIGGPGQGAGVTLEVSPGFSSDEDGPLRNLKWDANDWAETKPWEGSAEDIAAGKYKGIIYDPTARYAGRNNQHNRKDPELRGTISIGPFWDDAPPDFTAEDKARGKKLLLYHEAGHTVTAAITGSFQDWVKVAEPFRDDRDASPLSVRSSWNFGQRPEEWLSDVYSDLMVFGDGHYESDDYIALFKMVRHFAELIGFPTPPEGWSALE